MVISFSTPSFKAGKSIKISFKKKIDKKKLWCNGKQPAAVLWWSYGV